jgi:hypothetical protein
MMARFPPPLFAVALVTLLPAGCAVNKPWTWAEGQHPGVDHDNWTQTYANPALYEWFLQHRRVGAKP